MDSLKVIRRMLLGIFGLGFLAGIASLFENPGGAVLVVLSLGGAVLVWVVLSRRAAAPVPPRYSDSDLKKRVAAALRSPNKAFVIEVMGDVAAQWGDGKEWRKLGAKLAVLRGQWINVEIPDPGDWDESTLARLYPSVYGAAKEGNLDEYD